MNDELTIIVPVFNERESLPPFFTEMDKFLAMSPVTSRVLLINDGSTDGTADVLAARNDIRVIRHAKNRGYGAALMTAFEQTIEEGYEGVVTLDCDGQHQPKRIPRDQPGYQQ